jgi:hypothetical protein
MPRKIFFSLIFFILVVFLLAFYWLIPFNEVDFGFKEGNYDFAIENSSTRMQFYQNMRFPSSNISYRLDNCPSGKKDDMQRTFDIISNKTLLSFYNVENDEEIYVICDSRNKIEEGLFIAGEGGPTNITKTSNFNVIKKGTITLIKESKCQNPNIAIHELLHVLGFEHSSNPNNIMYNFSSCGQEISQDIIETINKLYSTQSHPDLSIGNVSAVMHGKYLDANLTIMNDGLKDSGNFTLQIYADNESVKKFDVEKLEIGYGKKIILRNIFVFQINTKELKFVIDYSQEEIDRKNNWIILNVKK